MIDEFGVGECRSPVEVYQQESQSGVPDLGFDGFDLFDFEQALADTIIPVLLADGIQRIGDDIGDIFFVFEASQVLYKKQFEDAGVLNEIVGVGADRCFEPFDPFLLFFCVFFGVLLALGVKIIYAQENKVIDVLEIIVHGGVGVAGPVGDGADVDASEAFGFQEVFGGLEEVAFYPLLLDLLVFHAKFLMTAKILNIGYNLK